MIGDDRSCRVCGASDGTVMVGTTLDDFFCSPCWIDTTKVPPVRQPPTPRLDAHIARIEREEAAADESPDEPPAAIPDPEPAQ